MLKDVRCTKKEFDKKFDKVMWLLYDLEDITFYECKEISKAINELQKLYKDLKGEK